MATPKVKIDRAVIGAIRDRFSVDNQQLASMAGTTHANVVDEWEAGTKQPTLCQAERLVEKLGLSILDLFSPSLPPDPIAGILDFRSSGTEETVKRRVALEDAQFLQLEYLRIAGDELEPLDEILPRADSREELFKTIPRVRELLGVSVEGQSKWKKATSARQSWRSALERLGLLVFHVRHVPTEAFRAFSIYHPLAPLIGVNSADSAAAHIFSYFHELGHLILRVGGTCDSFAAPADAVATERSCNEFAGSFLVPSDNLREAVDELWDADEIEESVASLAKQFSVSRQVLAVRLGRLKILSSLEVSRLFRVFGSQQYIRPIELESTEVKIRYEYHLRSIYGSRFIRGLISGVDAGTISLTEGLDLIQANSTYLSRLREVV